MQEKLEEDNICGVVRRSPLPPAAGVHIIYLVNQRCAWKWELLWWEWKQHFHKDIPFPSKLFHILSFMHAKTDCLRQTAQ